MSRASGAAGEAASSVVASKNQASDGEPHGLEGVNKVIKESLHRVRQGKLHTKGLGRNCYGQLLAVEDDRRTEARLSKFLFIVASVMTGSRGDDGKAARRRIKRKLNTLKNHREHVKEQIRIFATERGNATPDAINLGTDPVRAVTGQIRLPEPVGENMEPEARNLGGASRSDEPKDSKGQQSVQERGGIPARSNDNESLDRDLARGAICTYLKQLKADPRKHDTLRNIHRWSCTEDGNIKEGDLACFLDNVVSILALFCPLSERDEMQERHRKALVSQLQFVKEQVRMFGDDDNDIIEGVDSGNVLNNDVPEAADVPGKDGGNRSKAGLEAPKKSKEGTGSAYEDCHICCDNYTPQSRSSHSESDADRFPVILKCCGASVCRECIEKYRATETAKLPGNRKRIPCMQCKETFHCEDTPYVLNKPHAALIGSRKRARDDVDNNLDPSNDSRGKDSDSLGSLIQRVLEAANKKTTAARAKVEDAKREKGVADSTLKKALAHRDESQSAVEDAQRALEDAKRALEASMLSLQQAKDAAKSAETKLMSASVELENASKNTSKADEALNGLMQMDS